MCVSMSLLVTPDAKSYQILRRVITQLAAPLNVMDLKIVCFPAVLATPAVPLEDFTAELPIRFRAKFQAWPFGAESTHGVTCTLSRSCSLCSFGRPSTSLVSAG